MKTNTLILSILTIIFVGCGPQTKRPAENYVETIQAEENNFDTDPVASVDTLADTSTINHFDQTGLIKNKKLEQYLADDKIPHRFKELVKTGGKSLTDNCEALNDSLFSRDSERHPFYFWLFTQIIRISDGAVTEPKDKTLTLTRITSLKRNKYLFCRIYINFNTYIRISY